jgi:hypothetical protein
MPDGSDHDSGPLRSAGIVVLSRVHTPEQLTALLGVEPTGAREIRTPPSWRDSGHPTHLAWTLTVDRADPWLIEPYFKVLRPIIARLAEQPLVGAAKTTLSVHVEGRSQGFDLVFQPSDLVLIGRAGLELDVDCFSESDPD